MSITRLRATLGDFNINKMDGFEVKKSVSKIIMVRAMKCNIINHKINLFALFIKHPFYNTTINAYIWDYDIAIMKLSTPVTFSDKISPICLPNGRVPRIGNSGIVIGWVSHSKF